MGIRNSKKKHRRGDTIPYYNFVCRQCGHRFEVKVAISEKDEVVCPDCAAGNPRQVFSSVGLVKKASSGASVDKSSGGTQKRPFG